MKNFNPHPYAMTIVTLAICGVMVGKDGISADTSATVTTTTFDATAISVLNRDGQPVMANAQMKGRSKIKIAGAPAGSTAVFEEVGQQPEALVPNTDVPGEYWLPLVTTAKSGRVVLRQNGAAVFSMPLSVEPFENPNAVGDVAESALQAHMASREDALAALRKDGRSPNAVSLLEQAYTINTQMLEWIQQVRANGSAVMAYTKDGQPVMMTTDDVKRMDQEELWRLSLIPNFTGSQVSRLNAKELMAKLASLLVSSAHAQANANACMPKSPTLDNTIRQSLYRECLALSAPAKVDELRANIGVGTEIASFVGGAAIVASTLAPAATLVVGAGAAILIAAKVLEYSADSVVIVTKLTAGDASGAVNDATDVALKAAAGKLLDKSLKALKESAHGFLTQMDNVLENNQRNAQFYAKFSDPLNSVVEKEIGDDYLSEIVKGDGSAETQSQPQSEPLPVPGGGITPVPDPSSPPADQSQSGPLPVPGGGITPSTVPTTPTTSTPETIVTTTPTTDPRNKICELATGKADSRDPCSDRTPTSTPPTSTPPTTNPTTTPTTNPTTTPTTAPAITPTTTPSTTPPTSSGFCDRTDGHPCGVP